MEINKNHTSMEIQNGFNSCSHILCTSCIDKSIKAKLQQFSSMECENCDEIVLPEMYRDIISYDVFIKWIHARLAGDLKGKKKLEEVPISASEEQEKSTNSSPKSRRKGIIVLPRVRISSRQHRNSKNKVVIPFSIGSSSFSFDISIRPQHVTKNHKVKSKKVFPTFERGESSTSIPVPIDENFYCIICMDDKPVYEMYWVALCSHFFCTLCISNYISTKVEENDISIGCPDPECKDGTLEPDLCKDIIPSIVFERWTYALMEASLGNTKFYCPFSDCSGLMIDEGGYEITLSECLHCNRLFCAKCKVPWHSDISCDEFEKLGLDERGREDILLRNLAVCSKWQRCPQCQMYVERISGCKFINCRCGYCFCYACGDEMSKSNHSCPCNE